MAKKKLAVAVIHGIGSQGDKQPESTDDLLFSAELKQRVARELNLAEFDDEIAWREIFWSDVLQDRQQKYLSKIKRRTRSDKLRSFVLCNLSDASAYRKTNSDSNDNTYQNIHKRVTKTIADLERDVEAGSPLVILAHSLGGHIMSNYIYDINNGNESAATPFRNLKTMAGFITFGCNIPLFTFAYDQKKIFPIKFPGEDLPQNMKISPWWLNFYDKDDILGYPLKDIGPNYEKLVANGELKETPINAGNIFASWNPLSHNSYWKDDDLYRPISKFLKKFL